MCHVKNFLTERGVCLHVIHRCRSWTVFLLHYSESIGRWLLANLQVDPQPVPPGKIGYEGKLKAAMVHDGRKARLVHFFPRYFVFRLTRIIHDGSSRNR